MLGINSGCPPQSTRCSGRSQKEPKELLTLYPEPSTRVPRPPVIFRALTALADSFESNQNFHRELGTLIKALVICESLGGCRRKLLLKVQTLQNTVWPRQLLDILDRLDERRQRG